LEPSSSGVGKRSEIKDSHDRYSNEEGADAGE
jgi:hypothetical protein